MIDLFILYDAENEMPLFIGTKLDSTGIELSQYERMEVFYGKKLKFIIVEQLENQNIASSCEIQLLAILKEKYPNSIIYTYSDFVKIQFSHWSSMIEVIKKLNEDTINRNIEGVAEDEAKIKFLVSEFKKKFKRKYSIETLNKFKEVFKGHGNNFFNRKHSEETKQKIKDSKKKPPSEKLIASRKARRQKSIEARRGKTDIEIYGFDKAMKIREKIKATKIRNKLLKEDEARKKI